MQRSRPNVYALRWLYWPSRLQTFFNQDSNLEVPRFLSVVKRGDNASYRGRDVVLRQRDRRFLLSEQHKKSRLNLYASVV